MTFRISGLSPEPFRHLFGLSDDELARHGAVRCVADRKPGFPDRIEMRDAEPGETLLLLNHTCQPADTPYRASHAIFVREGALDTYDVVGEVPAVMRIRLLSLRAFDATGMMIDADVTEGVAVEAVIERMFAQAATSYIHVHNARRGCYSGRIDRADLISAGGSGQAWFPREE
nr:DUF1203 domain-containing protein [uncultured Lichenicoccus sp.]